MSDFENALVYVQRVLGEWRDAGSTQTAPLQALQALAATGPIVASPRKAEPPKPREDSTLAASSFVRRESPPTAPKVSPVAAVPSVPRIAKPVAPIIPSVPALPKLPPASANEASRPQQLAAWRASILKSAAPNDFVSIAHPDIVFGAGSAEAHLMFVGEAPGEGESLDVDPAETPAGQILAKMIVAMEVPMTEIYIAQVPRFRDEKRTSGQRVPTVAERDAGLERVREAIAIIRPQVIVSLGAAAIEGLLGMRDGIGKIRSQWQDFGGIPILATYHPAYLVRSNAPSQKRKVWEDLLMVLERLGRPISQKQQGYFLSKG